MTIQERAEYLYNHPDLAHKKSVQNFDIRGVAPNCASVFSYVSGLASKLVFIHPAKLSQKISYYFKPDTNGSCLAYRDKDCFDYEHFANDLGNGLVFHQLGNNGEFEISTLEESIEIAKKGIKGDVVVDRYSLRKPVKLKTFLNSLLL